MKAHIQWHIICPVVTKSGHWYTGYTLTSSMITCGVNSNPGETLQCRLTACVQGKETQNHMLFTGIRTCMTLWHKWKFISLKYILAVKKKAQYEVHIINSKTESHQCNTKSHWVFYRKLEMNIWIFGLNIQMLISINWIFGVDIFFC